MIAFTAFIMLFLLSFTAFIVSLVKTTTTETNIIKYYNVDTRAQFNASATDNSTLITSANHKTWGTIPGPYNIKAGESIMVTNFPDA